MGEPLVKFTLAIYESYSSIVIYIKKIHTQELTKLSDVIYFSGHMYWSACADNVFQAHVWNSFASNIQNNNSLRWY